MQSGSFEDAVSAVLKRDRRYAADAYRFLHGVLSESVKADSGDLSAAERHVGGAELLHAFRKEINRCFGPMAITVLEEWGLSRSEDIGEMVFNLIEVGAFGKSEDDCIEDFAGVYGFEEAFVRPYLPKSRLGIAAEARPSSG